MELALFSIKVGGIGQNVPKSACFLRDILTVAHLVTANAAGGQFAFLSYDDTMVRPY